MLKKLFILLFILLLAAYLVFAFAVLDQQPKGKTCQSVSINIMDSTNTAFITSQDISRLLKEKKLYPKGKKMEQIYCKDIESILKKNPLIQRAECYKTPRNGVSIDIYQRIPIIRIMANNGDDYYIDSEGKIMSNTHWPSQLVVATGYVNKKYAVRHLVPFARYLKDNEFWNDQIEQINVTSEGELEVVPRVGNHIVFLGKPLLIQEKLARLKIFYEKGLNVVGWNKYSRISLEFNNQVICTKRNKKI